MVVLGLKAESLYGFDEFELNLTYPKMVSDKAGTVSVDFVNNGFVLNCLLLEIKPDDSMLDELELGWER